MHPILADHPKMKAHVKAKAAAATQRDKLLAEGQRNNDAWHAAQREAFNAGHPPPDQPSDLRTAQSIADGFQVQNQALDRDLAADIAAEGDSLRARILSREDAVIGLAGELLLELDALLAEEGELRGALAEVARAEGGPRPSSTQLTLDMLARAAREDRRLLQEPLLVLGTHVGPNAGMLR
jgi:hypothetical protein